MGDRNRVRRCGMLVSIVLALTPSLRASDLRPITPTFRRELPACFSGNETLQTALPSARAVDFRGRHGNLGQRDFADLNLARDCDTARTLPGASVADRLQVAIATELLGRTREIARSDDRAELEHLLQLKACMNGTGEGCGDTGSDFVSAVQVSVHDLRQLLSRAQASSCLFSATEPDFFARIAPDCAAAPKIAHDLGFAVTLAHFFDQKDAKLEPLSATERAEAVAAFQTDFDRLRGEGLPWEKLAGRTAELHRKALSEYRALIERLPLLRFISVANPGVPEITSALDRIIDGSRTKAAESEQASLRTTAARSVPALNRALAEVPPEQRGDACEVATLLLDDVVSLRQGREVFLAAGAPVLGMALSPVAAASAGTAIGVGLAGLAGVHYQNEERKCIAGIDSPGCDAEALRRTRNSYRVALFLAPMAVISAVRAAAGARAIAAARGAESAAIQVEAREAVAVSELELPAKVRDYLAQNSTVLRTLRRPDGNVQLAFNYTRSRAEPGLDYTRSRAEPGLDFSQNGAAGKLTSSAQANVELRGGFVRIAEADRRSPGELNNLYLLIQRLKPVPGYIRQAEPGVYEFPAELLPGFLHELKDVRGFRFEPPAIP